jgi:hypothetical protein
VIADVCTPAWPTNLDAVTDAGEFNREILTWDSRRILAWIATVDSDPSDGSRYWWWNIRHLAQRLLYDQSRPADERRQWALVGIAVSQCAERFGLQRPHDAAIDRSYVRVNVIRGVGPEHDGGPWDPLAVTADVLDSMTMSPVDASSLSDDWRSLPVEDIRGLRRLKNRLGPVALIVDFLPAGDLRNQAERWLAVRDALP